MQIYKITCTVDDRSYIGLTTNNFDARYAGGNWGATTHNRYLKEAFNEYGPENFTVDILIDNISDKSRLHKLEEAYIKSFNTIYPNGFNLSKGCSYGCYSNVTLLGRKYVYPSGKLYIEDIKSLDAFCDKYHLSRTYARRYRMKLLKVIPAQISPLAAGENQLV